MNTIIYTIEQLRCKQLMLRIIHILTRWSCHALMIKILNLMILDLGDYVRTYKYKIIFAKGYTQNWSEEVFVIKKFKYTVP